MFSFVPAFMKVALMYGSKQLYLCLYLCYVQARAIDSNFLDMMGMKCRGCAAHQVTAFR